MFDADYKWKDANISIPNELFRSGEENEDKRTGILEVFDRYNFTIKEDEPLDKEVAVDPEMLGKVFENMLDISERKKNGAFYTPREIVHYMCQESLIHYLDNVLNSGTSSYQELGDGQTKLFGGSTDKKGNLKLELAHSDNVRVPKKDIEDFIRNGHSYLENDINALKKIEKIKAGEQKSTEAELKLSESIRLYAEFIDQKLTDIRICDPAIGSGDFPVGLLHELVNAMLVLKSHFSYDYLTEKLKGFGFEHRESISESRYIYRLKVFITTYDKPWYEFVKTNYLNKTPSWKCFEIYAGRSKKGFTIPIVKEIKVQGNNDHLNYFIQTTENYHDAGDNKASGVYLRSAFEAILKQFCFGKVTVKFVIDQSKLKTDEFWSATKKFVHGRPNPTTYNLTQITKDEIDNLLPLVLNPLSHNDINKNEHSSEINRTINILRTLKNELNV